MLTDELNILYNEGLLEKQVHPNLPLTIWNYSPKVQIERLWHTNELLGMCRGLVTDTEGNIIARPFKKFFNYGELDPTTIPNLPFQIFEKMDGSLGILFYYEGEVVFASRGSFTSEQSVKGREILDKYRMTLLGDNDIYEAMGHKNINDYTLMCEIIYPSNRIVVNYGDMEDVVLLAMINKNDGSEIPYDALMRVGEVLDMPVVKRHYVKFINGVSTYEDIKKTITDDEEGRVVMFDNGFRMKIKGDEYIRLHYILTNISTRDIWQMAKDQKSIEEILVDVPDEFYKWAIGTYNGLISKFNAKKAEVEEEFWILINKKEFAAKVKGRPNEHFLFRRLNSYSDRLDEMIWDKLYPDYYKPFSNKTMEDDI